MHSGWHRVYDQLIVSKRPFPVEYIKNGAAKSLGPKLFGSGRCLVYKPHEFGLLFA